MLRHVLHFRSVSTEATSILASNLRKLLALNFLGTAYLCNSEDTATDFV
jgi:hypothetical protein